MKKLIAKLFGLYTEKDLVSFGTYLLSEKRAQQLKVWTLMDGNSITYEDKRRNVFDADFDQWKHQ